MEARRANAYRHLLYMAMVDIRSLAVPHSWACVCNPRHWFRSRYKPTEPVAIADWLHNMASFSAIGFEKFDEDRSWREYEDLCRRYPGPGLERYREAFDMAIMGRPGGASYWPNPG